VEQKVIPFLTFCSAQCWIFYLKGHEQEMEKCNKKSSNLAISFVYAKISGLQLNVEVSKNFKGNIGHLRFYHFFAAPQ
jgi:hypothetical protein